MGEPPLEASKGKGERTVTRKWEDKEGKHTMVEKTNKDTGDKSVHVDGKPVEKPKASPQIQINLNDVDKLNLRLMVEIRDLLTRVDRSLGEINYRMDKEKPLTKEQNEELANG